MYKEKKKKKTRPEYSSLTWSFVRLLRNWDRNSRYQHVTSANASRPARTRHDLHEWSIIARDSAYSAFHVLVSHDSPTLLHIGRIVDSIGLLRRFYDLSVMPEAVATPQKRVLGDASNNPRGILKSPDASKKRKIDNRLSARVNPPSQNGQRKVPGSSQLQKSQFEEEVLEKLTQDINDLKDSNAEKDQQWERPPLGEFDPTKENVCFQQIDAEEGTLLGGKPAVRLFGVTEVLSARCR